MTKPVGVPPCNRAPDPGGNRSERSPAWPGSPEPARSSSGSRSEGGRSGAAGRLSDLSVNICAGDTQCLKTLAS